MEICIIGTGMYVSGRGTGGYGTILFQQGDLGLPLYTWTEYSQRKSVPSEVFRTWVEKINILQYLGVHYIDIVRFVSGAKPVKVMAMGQKSWR